MSKLFWEGPRPSRPHPHAEFLALYLVVERHARIVFRDRRADEREEAVAEAVAAAFEAYIGLKRRGKDPLRDFPSAVATFAALHVKDHRHVGGRSSSTDALSPKARQLRGFRLRSLPCVPPAGVAGPCGAAGGRDDREACEELLRDNTMTPVPDQVCFRLDWPAFLRTLSRRDRRLARFLALGHSGKDAARQFGISPARVTQLRRHWRDRWLAFQGEAPLA